MMLVVRCCARDSKSLQHAGRATAAMGDLDGAAKYLRRAAAAAEKLTSVRNRGRSR